MISTRPVMRSPKPRNPFLYASAAGDNPLLLRIAPPDPCLSSSCRAQGRHQRQHRNVWERNVDSGKREVQVEAEGQGLEDDDARMMGKSGHSTLATARWPYRAARWSAVSPVAWSRQHSGSQVPSAEESRSDRAPASRHRQKP